VVFHQLLRYFRDHVTAAFLNSSSRRGGGAAGSFGYDCNRFSAAMDIYATFTRFSSPKKI